MLLRESILIHHRVKQTPGLSNSPRNHCVSSSDKRLPTIISESTSYIERVQIKTMGISERGHAIQNRQPNVNAISSKYSIAEPNSSLQPNTTPTSIAAACHSPTNLSINEATQDNSTRLNAIEKKLASDAAPPAPKIFHSIHTNYETLKNAWKKNDNGKRDYKNFVPGLLRGVLMSPFWLIGIVYAGPRHLADKIHQWSINDLKSDTPKHSKLFWAACSLLAVPIRLTVPLAILALHLTTGIGGLAVTLFLEAVVISEEAVKSSEGNFKKMLLYRAIEDLVYGVELLLSYRRSSNTRNTDI